MSKKYKYEKQVTINGKRKVFRADTLRELNKKMLDFQEEAEAGKLFEDVAEEWKEEHWKKLEYNSTKNYNGAFKRVLAKFSGIRIKDIEPLDIDRYLKEMALQQFAKKTISNTKCIINMICVHAVIQGYIKLNPCSCITVTQGKPTKRRTPITPEQIQIVIDNRDSEFGLYPFFLMYTGMRPSEPLSVTGQDIDLKKRTINVCKSSFWDEHSKPHVKETKTEAGDRYCLILEPLMPYLQKIKKDELVFPGKNGIMTKSEYDKAWKNYRKRTGLTATAYQLRHTYATICKKANVKVKDAQHLLGHANYATTMDIYTHFDDEALTISQEKLDEYIHTQHTPTTKNPDNY